MNRLNSVFADKAGALFIAYLTVGYPSLEETVEAVLLLEKSGADIIELGIPFSDPLVDGVTIQQAGTKALQNGVNIKRCIEAVRLIREKSNIPLIFMGYYNPILQYGPETFCADSFSAGADGLIIPDLPPEEAGLLEETALQHGLDLIYLIAPSTPDERIKYVAARSRGFLYLVSVEGVTGVRENLPPGLQEFVERVKKYAVQPLCMGFGISTPEQAGQVARLVDGVIIGSNIIRHLSDENWRTALPAYVRELKNFLRVQEP